MTALVVGSLVTARGREWVVLPESRDDFLVLRPLGGSDDDIAGLFPAIETVTPASFPPPRASDLGDQLSARLLRSALQIGFRSSAGPFRSLAGISVEPRAYQLVPLLMALRQETVRLLIADDVGIGKTIEAGLVASELLAIGEATALTVLCSPALAEQWADELRTKFALEAELVLASTVRRLERQCIAGESIFERFPITVVSTDFIKSDRRRNEFLRTCPDLVIVDEAHTCVADGAHTGRARTQRYDLVRDLAKDPDRHLILVTATPHSGKEETFRNLIGLLDPQLHELDLDQTRGRELLARHFVQRRRADIRQFLDEDTPFPSDRLSKEVAYELSPAYRDLFDDVLEYARETVRDAHGVLEKRVNWWSVLALLRSLASSPRAAAQTLSTRSAALSADDPSEADALGRSAVLDLADDETLESVDAAPGADPSTAGTSRQRKLRDFLKRAQALEGKDDRKLDVVTTQVKALLADSYAPIVFCRFIDTAEYVAEHLSKKLGSGTTVACVTGILPPSERIARINELSQADGPVVLVATDCLSEGVNLQNQFQAVVHYDLAWNPTRHEQREGRVDRFGQQRDIVRTVTLYGRDNHIDGIVLDVLLRKHEAIRKSTGVSVPVPDSSDAVLEALMEGLILRGGRDYRQETLDFEYEQRATDLAKEWQSAAEREKASRTKFAQRSIHPEEVAAEVAEIRENLGTHAEVRTFTRDALLALKATINTTPRGFTAATSPLPGGLLDALPPRRDGALNFVDDFPVGKGENVLHRTDPAVEAIASYVLESALDSGLPIAARPARRCAVVRTADVTVRTTLLLVRHRFHLTLPSRSGDKMAVAEDIATLGFTTQDGAVNWLDEDAITALLDAEPVGNVINPEQHMQSALNRLPELEEHLSAHGDVLAEKIRTAHRRVRAAAGGAVRGLNVRAENPPDVLGVYVFVPVPKG